MSSGALGEIFGVPEKRHAGSADDALLHRRRDHGVEFVAKAAIACEVQQIENIAGIGDIQFARLHGSCDAAIDDS